MYAESALSQFHTEGHEDAFYVPNFITPEEEQYLIRKICESPQPLWKSLANRRLQTWGGEITTKGTLVPQPLPPFVNKFPDLVSRIKATGFFKNSPHAEPNQIIMNEYLPGQGIMPHEDGPRYYPVVATLSLGSHAVFHYYRYQAEADGDAVSSGQGRSINMIPVSSVLLEPRSLIISSGSIYTSHLHGIDALEEDLIALDASASGIKVSNVAQLQDPAIKVSIHQGVPIKRGTRYSLTCRDVERVSVFSTHPRR
ncbi:hypothetical protein CPB84DRAFT_1680744 [Gymnopilus junonius]|uniref:Fe2OG dioxygenase domain-containing protein n=1 Tax=Gymnopilus junonius TaxID=109634 RepID=A0A9P5NNZ2_GYMJU|nr:hypothetical protein CPB84DRAFT_1680744 [Gymnopilus junonius]